MHTKEGASSGGGRRPNGRGYGSSVLLQGPMHCPPASPGSTLTGPGVICCSDSRSRDSALLTWQLLSWGEIWERHACQEVPRSCCHEVHIIQCPPQESFLWRRQAPRAHRGRHSLAGGSVRRPDRWARVIGLRVVAAVMGFASRSKRDCSQDMQASGSRVYLSHVRAVQPCLMPECLHLHRLMKGPDDTSHDRWLCQGAGCSRHAASRGSSCSPAAAR